MDFKLIILLFGFTLLLSCSDNFKQLDKITITECLINGKWCVSESSYQKSAILFPEKITYLKPFLVKVTFQKKNKSEIQAVQLRYSMLGMEMGINKFNLELTENMQTGQSWQVNSIIPICVAERKDWLINLKYEQNNKIYNDYFKITIN